MPECQLCKRKFKLLNLHLLKKHNMAIAKYRERFPDEKLVADSIFLGRKNKTDVYGIKRYLNKSERIFYEKIESEVSERYGDVAPSMKQEYLYCKLNIWRAVQQHEKLLRSSRKAKEENKNRLERTESLQKIFKSVFRKLKYPDPPPAKIYAQLLRDGQELPPDGFLEKIEEILPIFSHHAEYVLKEGNRADESKWVKVVKKVFA